jgi:hypothetical protein
LHLDSCTLRSVGFGSKVLEGATERAHVEHALVPPLRQEERVGIPVREDGRIFVATGLLLYSLLVVLALGPGVDALCVVGLGRIA